MSENSNRTREMLADKEKIMSLEGQVAELSDRVAEYEQAEMLRRVSEDEAAHREAEEMTAMRLEEALSAERERIREEERIKAESAAKRKFEDREKEIELKSQDLQLKSDGVDAALKRLAADKARFEVEKSELIKGVEVKYEKLLEEREQMFQRKIDEIRTSLDARMVDAEESAIESVKRLLSSVGGTAEEQERAISEVKSTLSELKSTSVAGLVEVARKMHQSGKSKERHLRYCLRRVFGSTSEKLHDDEALSLVDSVLESEGLETSESLRQAYKAAKAAVIRIKTLSELKRLAKESEKPEGAAEEVAGPDCRMVDSAYLRSLPQHGAPIVLYPDEYLKDPSRYVEIKRQSGRDAHYELLITPEKHEVMKYELPVYVERGNPSATPIQAKVEDYRPYPKSFASPELVSKMEVERFVDCDPIYTQEKRHERNGINLSRQLMDKLHARTCELLEPLFDLHYYDVVKGEYLLGDGSPVRIVNTETHKCDKHYMAHVVCLDKNAAVFNLGSRVDMDGNILSHGRASEDLELLCKEMTNAKAFEKDGYAGWSRWLKRNGITECGCNAHSRREFEESRAEDPLPSGIALGFYALLNMVEHYIKAEGLTGKRKKDIRMELEKPIWTAFVSWATAEREQHPKGSAISGALDYLLKRRKELMAYLKIPMMPIDNNACERGFKPLVKGRKTSLFFQNLMGAWRASMMYSFFETCSMNHLNPQQWLTYVLDHIKTTPEAQLPNLLPQNFDKDLLKLV